MPAKLKLRLLIQMPAHISWWLSWFPSEHRSGGRAKASLACLHFLLPLQQLTLSPAPFFDAVSDSPRLLYLLFTLACVHDTHGKAESLNKRATPPKISHYKRKGKLLPRSSQLKSMRCLFDHFKCFSFILNQDTWWDQDKILKFGKHISWNHSLSNNKNDSALTTENHSSLVDIKLELILLMFLQLYEENFDWLLQFHFRPCVVITYLCLWCNMNYVIRDPIWLIPA